MSKKNINKFLILILVLEILTTIFVVGYKITEIKIETQKQDLEKIINNSIKIINLESQNQYLKLYIIEYDKPFYVITEDDRYMIE